MSKRVTKRKGGFALLLGIIGAAFFFGDAMITPAISVLSAVEGLTVINSSFEPFVVPLTLAVLMFLFLFQYHGTAGVASLLRAGHAGVVPGPRRSRHHAYRRRSGDPPRLQSDSTAPACSFDQPGLALLVLGGVFLAVTGGEALYADMGHFGKKPIRLAWICVVFPGLVLNYLGQGAFLHANPEAIANPFYLMAPSWALIPLVILATLVTVIASQAVITGAFSIAQQAMSLGLLPRMNITHTSESESGQIYIGQINWMLLVGVILLVLVFKSSTNLASAYGIAVNTSMLIDTLLAAIFFWKSRNLPPALVLPAARRDLPHRSDLLRRQRPEDHPWRLHAGPDRRRASSCMMVTWMHGRAALAAKLRRDSVELVGLLESPRAAPADPRRRRRGVPADRSDLCAKRAHAQSQAQSRAARHSGLHHRGNER